MCQTSAVQEMVPTGSSLRYRQPTVAQLVFRIDPHFQVITIFKYSATEDHLCILVELRGS